MKPTLLLLTNFHHSPLEEFEEEDIFLANYLRKHFHVILSHPLDCEQIEDKADIVLIRNVWPVFPYEDKWNKIKERFRKKKLKVYPPLTAKGDMVGKDHLITLFSLKYPVIPTVDKISEINKLGKTEFYFIKPKNMCDAIGTEKLTKEQLLNKTLNNYVIQPYIDFEYEVSFYVIDNKILYSFSTPRKVYPYEIKDYSPTKEDIEFVNKFLKWNNLPHSLQRIDACRTKDGKLLLVEVEDFSPYLHLLDMNDKIRSQFLDKLNHSLNKVTK